VPAPRPQQPGRTRSQDVSEQAIATWDGLPERPPRRKELGTIDPVSAGHRGGGLAWPCRLCSRLAVKPDDPLIESGRAFMARSSRGSRLTSSSLQTMDSPGPVGRRTARASSETSMAAQARCPKRTPPQGLDYGHGPGPALRQTPTRSTRSWPWIPASRGRGKRSTRRFFGWGRSGTNTSHAAGVAAGRTRSLSRSSTFT